MKLFIKVIEDKTKEPKEVVKHARFVSTDKIDISFTIFKQQHIFAIGRINFFLSPSVEKDLNEIKFSILNDIRSLSKYSLLHRYFKEGKDMEICFEYKDNDLILSEIKDLNGGVLWI